jgi:hypothetical protein
MRMERESGAGFARWGWVGREGERRARDNFFMAQDVTPIGYHCQCVIIIHLLGLTPTGYLASPDNFFMAWVPT